MNWFWTVSYFPTMKTACDGFLFIFLTAQISVKLPAYFTENNIRIRTSVTTSTSSRLHYIRLVETNYQPRLPHLHHKNKPYWTWGKSLLLLAMFTSPPQRRKEIRTEPEQFTDLGNDQWEIFEPPPALQARFRQVTKWNIPLCPKTVGGRGGICPFFLTD